MKITFFDSELRKKSIYYHWISLLWQPKYNDVGSFCVEFQASSDVLGTVSPMDYAMIDTEDTVMIVTTIEFAKNKCVIRGKSADYLLTQRISDTVVKNENAENAMLELVTNMSPFPIIEVGEPQGFPEKYTAQTSDSSIQQYCATIAKAVDMGYRLRKNGEKLIFECYKPPLNTSVKFSAFFGNLVDEKYAESINNYANVAVVAGQGSGTDRITVTVGDTESSGFARHEIYIDARNEQQEENETLDDYKERLKRYGEKKLAETNKIKNLQFTVSAGDNLRLGDLVYVTPSYSGIKMEARVVSLSIKCQKNTITKTASVGTPIGA